MNRVDLHPEDLLDALHRDGGVPSGEQERLDEHLASCAPCSFERLVARDFAAELERQDPAARAAIEAAACGALEDPRVVARLGRGPSPVGPVSRRRYRLLLVAAVLFAATLGAAGAAWYALIVLGRSGNEPPPAPAVCPPASTGLVGSTVYTTPATPAPSAPRGNVPEALAPAPPPVEALPPPAVSPTPSARNEPPPDAGPGDQTAGDDAATLFSRANAARRVRDYGSAAALYDELGRRFAGSREELISRVTFGTLLLDVLAQPQRALALFDSYLAAARGGTMAEEALVGRALALGRLGRPAEEAAAGPALLAEFPGSAHAERARRRLQEIP
jgi:hypothetical protein